MTDTLTPVSPDVTVDGCAGTVTPVEVEGISYTVETFNADENLVIALAAPDQGYEIELHDGWAYYHSSPIGSLLVDLDDYPCETVEEVPTPAPGPPPLDGGILPATGVDDGTRGLLMIVALIVIAFGVPLIAWRGRRAQR